MVVQEELELELIQPHMAQKPVLRGEVGCGKPCTSALGPLVPEQQTLPWNQLKPVQVKVDLVYSAREKNKARAVVERPVFI